LIALRADASASIGVGHIKRSVSLAKALQAAGCETLLLSRPSDVAHAIATPAGVRHAMLTGLAAGDIGNDDASADARATIDALRGLAPAWVIVDHYSLGADWHRAVADALGTRIGVIDDLGNRTLATELLIDHNLDTDHRTKYAACLDQGATTAMLCGPRFALLGPAFADAAPNAIEHPVRSIGIFVGGADAAGISIAAAEGCRTHAGFTGLIEIATTRFNPQLTALRAWCEADAAASLSVDQPDLAAFFGRHGLHVGAGGGATWERCRVGAPTLALCCAANQLAVIPTLAAIGVVATPTPTHALDAASIGRAVACLLGDAAQRHSMAERSRALVDGRGAQRVAVFLNASALQARRASQADAGLAHRWRNHRTTREASSDTREIDWATHNAWWQASLARDDRLMLIGSVGSIDVGVIRFDLPADGRAAEVSLYLDPALHGLGLGGRLLSAGERELHALHPAAVSAGVDATVRADNAASQRMFSAAGYTRCGDTVWHKADVTNNVAGASAAKDFA